MITFLSVTLEKRKGAATIPVCRTPVAPALFDDRSDSPTRGLVAKIVLSEYRRQLINIPAGAWHANQNIGGEDVVAGNFPTRPHDHERPDKYRVPIDTDTITYRFEQVRGR